MTIASVASLWRYPVKSMRGERVEDTDVADTGFAGDRAYAVIDPGAGKVGSAKHPRLWGALLQCEARYLGEQYCTDCRCFCRRIGPGGLCPACDAPVAIADLLLKGGDRSDPS